MMKAILAILFVAISSVLTAAQSRDKPEPEPTAKPAATRDLSFANGVDLQFLIKTLGREMDLNVLFDVESRLENRKTKIELRNVTTEAAFNYLLLQEHLCFEPVGPKTVLVANDIRATLVSSWGIRVQRIGEQLAEYFGVTRGIMVVSVYDDLAAQKAGLKAGDVRVAVEGVRFEGTLGLIRALEESSDNDVSLDIVRDHESLKVTVTPNKGLKTVLLQE